MIPPTSEQIQLTERFLDYVVEWGREFDHWKNLGRLEIHKRNLGIACERYAEKMEEYGSDKLKEKNRSANVDEKKD